ncbi:MAG TPA: tRNA1(Val) (adenine(37)-N6)-methyltransferase [Syntrophomonadaceae bacterium]|nr:tRNA1(Val) (adenine(37)-N6)-methyltransferase [Syntrophomonadaceae bacterium]
MDKQAALYSALDETADELILGNYRLIQGRAGYRFSIDAVLLAHFAQLDDIDKAVDLGAGNGVIPLLLAARSAFVHITGIEVQPAMVDRARRSLVLNGLQDRIDIIQADVREIPSHLPAASTRLVLCNPPFQRRGRGRISQHPEKALARHELTATLSDFVAAASYLLNQGGKFCLIHRSERLPEILDLFRSYKLSATRLRMVQAFSNREAGLFLLEGTKGTGNDLIILPPLVIYEQAGIYHPEVLQWYRKPDGEEG